MDWEQYIYGFIMFFVGMWWANQRPNMPWNRMKYRWSCPHCSTRFEMSHNPNKTLERMARNHLIKFHHGGMN